MGLAPSERDMLIEMARSALRSAVGGEKSTVLPEARLPAALKEKCGAFVTLTRRGRLRGCIGLIEGCFPLAETVVKMAESAALHDPRFMPVTRPELDDLEMEISVLSPLKRVASADEIVLGRDGVVVKSRGRSGVFLPQVAEETGWSREQFFNELCSGKAGLPADAWKSPDCELYAFTVELLHVKKI